MVNVGFIASNLREMCRDELQITWRDHQLEARLEGHIKNGVEYLAAVTGATELDDFRAGGKACALLLAYVRRAMSGDLSTFEADYMADIIRLQIECEVTERAKEEAESV